MVKDINVTISQGLTSNLSSKKKNVSKLVSKVAATLKTILNRETFRVTQVVRSKVREI